MLLARCRDIALGLVSELDVHDIALGLVPENQWLVLVDVPQLGHQVAHDYLIGVAEDDKENKSSVPPQVLASKLADQVAVVLSDDLSLGLEKLLHVVDVLESLHT